MKKNSVTNSVTVIKHNAQPQLSGYPERTVALMTLFLLDIFFFMQKMYYICSYLFRYIFLDFLYLILLYFNELPGFVCVLTLLFCGHSMAWARPLGLMVSGGFDSAYLKDNTFRELPTLPHIPIMPCYPDSCA